MGYTAYGASTLRSHLQGTKVGLILEPVQGQPHVFQRVGMFAHLCNKWEGDKYTPKPPLGQYTEFAGFDINSYEHELQRVTII